MSAAFIALLCLAATGAGAPRGFAGIHGDLGLLAVVALHLWLPAVGVALLRRSG